MRVIIGELSIISLEHRGHATPLATGDGSCIARNLSLRWTLKSSSLFSTAGTPLPSTCRIGRC